MELISGSVWFCDVCVRFNDSNEFAPRKPPSLRDVWPAAVLVAVFQRFGQNLFEWYLSKFTNLNAIYGAFRTIMGLLLWIYRSGVVAILGGCLSATARDPVPS